MTEWIILSTILFILVLGYNHLSKVNGLPRKYMPVIVKVAGLFFTVTLFMWLGEMMFNYLFIAPMQKVFGHIG